MDDERIIELIRDFQEREIPDLVPRELDVILPKATRCVSVVGPRRAGKSSLLYLIIDRLRGSVGKEGALYINLEDDRLYPPDTGTLDRVLRTYFGLYPDARGRETHLFLDEVQMVEGWERFVRRVMDTERVRVWLTGSSSALVRDQVATAMRGRCISYTLLPFSFREFMRAHGTEWSTNPSSRERAMVVNFLREYMAFGGFPDVAIEEDPAIKLRVLGEYVDVMLLRDVVERHRVANIPVLRMLFGRLLSSVSSTFSINRFHGMLKSQGVSVSKNTLYDYFSHLEDALAIVPLRRFSQSLKQVHQSLPKVYPVDTGFIAWSKGGAWSDSGGLMETTIAIELFRRTCLDPTLDLYYWSEQGVGEVDFVLLRGREVDSLVQSCYDLGDETTKGRELRALVKAANDLDCQDLTVVTWDEDGELSVQGRTIKILPLRKWLLESLK